MLSQSFYLLGDAPASARTIAADENASLEDLADLIASHFAIVVPSGIGFVRGDETLSSVKEILSSEEPIAISIDGHAVRDVPGPKGLPYVGNFFEIFPDHLGNHQRLFDKYGPVFQTTNLGTTVYHTNDPDIAAIAFAESDFFTKEINESHPLHSIKTPEAGIFLGDTDTEEWRITHKFLPPALGPRAVRHYVPTMQETIESAYKVFDELDELGESWNVFMYMMKLGSQAVAKLTLGMDLQHFTHKDAPIHEVVNLVAGSLHLMKQVNAYGKWYAALPFGAPRNLARMKARMETLVNAQIQRAESNGTADLPLQEAAEHAANMVDYALRATDAKGGKLPKSSLAEALVVATGAGFTTTSSLLSWLIYALVTYPGVQDRLLQELVDAGFSDALPLTGAFTDALPYLDAVVKETQRRHNPSYQPARTARTDLVLPRGYKVPRGTVLIPALHHLHNNPALWDNPARFDPDRWATPAVQNRHRAAYLPFATGPRGCIGFNFALQEVKVFVTKLVWRYRFVRDGDEPVEYDPMFQLIRPNNLYVRAVRRVKWPPRSEEGEA